MKLSKIFTGFCAITLGVSAITAITLFSDFNTKGFINVNIFTKKQYLELKNSQNVNNNENKSIAISYLGLPTTKYKFNEVTAGSTKINGGNYIFSFGSLAYEQTNTMLFGDPRAYSLTANTPVNSFSNSIMLRLYDLFFANATNQKDRGLENINPLFLNYLDLPNTVNVVQKNSEMLANISLGVKDPNLEINSPSNSSKVWILPSNDKAEDDEQIQVFQEGVNPVFDYTPNLTSGYSYIAEKSLPSYKEFTDKEKEFDRSKMYTQVKYRDTENVKTFLNSYNYWSSYNSLTNSENSTDVGSPAKEASLLLVRNIDASQLKEKDQSDFAMKILTTFDTTAKGTDNLLNQITKFYNPDFVIPGEGETIPPAGEETPPTPPVDEVPPVTKAVFPKTKTLNEIEITPIKFYKYQN